MTQPAPVSSPFAITAASNSVRLDAARKAQTAFTVTNASGRTLTGRAILQPVAADAAGWFSLAGPAERPFAPNEVFQYSVNISAPPDAMAGPQVFTLNMVDVANPDEFFSSGPPVTVEVPEAAPGVKPFNWAIPIALIVAVVTIGAVLAYVLLRSPNSGISGEVSVVNSDLVDLDTEAGKSDLTFGALLSGAFLTPTSAEFQDIERRAGQIDFWYLVATNTFAFNETTGRVHDGGGLSYGDDNTQFVLIDDTNLVYATGSRVIDLRGAKPSLEACRDTQNSPEREAVTQLTGANVAFCLQTSEGRRSFVELTLGSNPRTDPAIIRWTTR
ncbi:MAG: hypothetical protein GEU75_02320 [Dehalococcoidia bacterium]|nr:hypothetical protein [Dehalococcoidia bacterium]